MSIIVLEGPDCAGKTTLAFKIKSLIPKTKYIHMTYRWKHKPKHYYLSALNYATKLQQKGFNVIVDRWVMSEEAYANVYRNGSELVKFTKRIMPIFEQFGTTVICLPPKEFCVKQHILRLDSEMYESIDKVYDYYEAIAYGDKYLKAKGYFADIARSKNPACDRAFYRVINPIGMSDHDIWRLYDQTY